MPRSPSPSMLSQRNTKPTPSTAGSPLLIPHPGRSALHRLTTQQRPSSPRASPYPSPSPSPSPPGVSRPGMSRRPGPPRRTHSFCATEQQTFALASASTSSHLSPDKACIVAPPLERTLSSIGSKGNMSSPEQRMARPLPDLAEILEEDDMTTPKKARFGSSDGRMLTEMNSNLQLNTPGHSPVTILSPSPVKVPTILVHPSLSPPRPSLAPLRTSSASSSTSASTTSSHSSSYTIVTPASPRGMLFNVPVRERDLDEEMEDVDGVLGYMDVVPAAAGKKKRPVSCEAAVERVVDGVDRLALSR
ncbi:hypothetical protein I350_00996 [Cryptococcus amylolentus CBS 6273]|nr:hypothetical protein I350_00996 [Cryptococcus amylolentus CBS 6273]